MKSMLAALCLSGHIHAQTLDLAGKVVDDSGKAVAQAAIQVKGSSLATQSAADGTFRLAGALAVLPRLEPGARSGGLREGRYADGRDRGEATATGVYFLLPKPGAEASTYLPLTKTAAAACTLSVTKTGYHAGTYPQTSGVAANLVLKLSRQIDSVAGVYHPENFPNCARPTIYVNDAPNDARVKELESKVGGAAGVKATLDLTPKMACAVLYATPQDVPAGTPAQARFVMNISPTHRWPDQNWTDPATGKTYYDYPAGDMERISPDGDVVIQAFGSAQHEVTHVVTPPGNKHPKWIEETLADFVRLKAGYTDIKDKPETIKHHYCDGYNTGAYFFEWIETKVPGFVHKLSNYITMNKDNAWLGGYPTNETNSEQVFVQVTGGTGLAALWSEYKKTLPSPPAGPTSCGVDMWSKY